MPQSIFVQVGQCGNEVGFKFWKYACQEYMHSDCISDVAVDTFFEPTHEWTTGKSFQDCCKARSVLVDMEENVISQGIEDVGRSLFRQDQVLTDKSGLKSNWSEGYLTNGWKHQDTFQNIIRREAERCDNLRTFILAFSLGGGTGSGLGTYILKHLTNEYQNKISIVFTSFPSINDDVVTSPYNALLGNNELVDMAQIVIPFENLSLQKICEKKFQTKSNGSASKGKRNFKRKSCVLSSKATVPKAGTSSGSAIAQDIPFDYMNRVMSYTILDFTSSCRFSGTRNQDLADIMPNLVPYSNINYVIPSITPLSPKEINSSSNKLVKDILSGSNQLTSHPISRGKIYSCMLQARGPISILEIEPMLRERYYSDLNFFEDNDCVKFGTCDVPRIDFNRSLLQLTNCTSIAVTFTKMYGNFLRIYNKREHLHQLAAVDSGIEENLKDAVDKLIFQISEYTSETGDADLNNLMRLGK